MFYVIGELFACTAFHCKGNFNDVMGELLLDAIYF